MKRITLALWLSLTSIGFVQAETIVLWDFQTLAGEPPVSTGTTDPATGSGSIVTIGGVTHVGFNSGNGSSDPVQPGLGYQTTDSYPDQGTNSGTAGIQVAVATTGFKDIVVSFDLRTSNTSSRWYQMQYSTDGVDFVDFGSPIRLERFNANGDEIGTGDFWSNSQTFDLSGISEANDNPNFTFRVVSVFSPVAFTQFNGSIEYDANEAYEAARNRPAIFGNNSVYAGGTWRFDMVTVSGSDVSASEATVEDSYVFYADWNGLGSEVDIDKQPYQETGTPTPLAFANLTNAAQGITGVGFVISGLGDSVGLSASDFDIRISPPGIFDEQNNLPEDWDPAPSPSVSVITGDTSDDVRLEWSSLDSAKNRWLRIVIKANATTGLSEEETFYVGHLLGESTGLDAPLGTFYSVTFADVTAIRAEVGQTVGANGVADIDKSGSVTFTDISVMRSNVGAQLTNISVP